MSIHHPPLDPKYVERQSQRCTIHGLLSIHILPIHIPVPRATRPVDSSIVEKDLCHVDMINPRNSTPTQRMESGRTPVL